MGPALLPTPLSPMRGQFLRTELGIRCFAVPLCRSVEFQVCHRRSHRHPDPSSGGFFDSALGRSHRFHRIPRHQRAAPRSDTRTGSLKRWRLSGPKTIRNVPIGCRPGDPARDETFAHLHHRPPLRRAEALHSEFLRKCGTGPATSFRSQIFRSIRLLSRQVRSDFVPFRCVEAASRAPIRQEDKASVFHFPPFSLWTGVDKSSIRRKC